MEDTSAFEQTLNRMHQQQPLMMEDEKSSSFPTSRRMQTAVPSQMKRDDQKSNSITQLCFVQALNVNDEESTMSANELMLHNSDPNPGRFIVSDADEELLIMIKFNEFIDIQSIKMYALPLNDDMRITDASPPKQIHIYKLSNLDQDFEDIKGLKPHKSMVCSSKKLSKGQTVNLRKNITKPLAFRKVKYMAIFIESNQDNTEFTYLHGISLKNNSTVREQSKSIECEAVSAILDDFSTIQDTTQMSVESSPMNQIQDHINELCDVDEPERQKGIKLLQRICSNILADPTNPKFRDLNFAEIGQRFDQCQIALILLFDIGFSLSTNGQRLKLNNNEVNIKNIRVLDAALRAQQSAFGRGTDEEKVRARNS